ncbi:hypothetical protein DRO32_00565 [Candidatus Bathyarchaeota archaeon]|nr:MAG: hypothetical protein DRO32_00565 [Candidatus Bathyarchaeota archaeon]
MALSVVVSFRIDRKLKEEMDKFKHINWSAVVREAIARKIEEEKRKALMREKDFSRIRKAARLADELSRRAEGWSSVAEIRRWRETR